MMKPGFNVSNTENLLITVFVLLLYADDCPNNDIDNDRTHNHEHQSPICHMFVIKYMVFIQIVSKKYPE